MNINSEINNNPILIGVEEACKIVGIGKNTMYKLIKMKGFPALIFPHKVLIDKNNLESWISKNYGIYRK